MWLVKVCLVWAQLILCKCDGVKIVNLRVHRAVDLRAQNARITDLIKFKNTQENPISSYDYVLYNPGPHSLKCGTGKGLSFTEVQTNQANISTYRFFLDKEVRENEVFKLLCQTMYPKGIRSLFKKRQILENQTAIYESNSKYFSLYKTIIAQVEFTFKNNESLIETQISPSENNGAKLTYINFNLEPYSFEPNKIIFVNNDPFLVVKTLERMISVSHYGKIFIEDTVTLANDGPTLIGPYSTFDNKKASIKHLFTHLPGSAQDIKFFDEIGNCSQTKVYDYGSFITLKFSPRYPLLGGWKTTYTLAYSVPTYEYLYVSGNMYNLKIRTVDYVIDGATIEYARIKIRLPEGAHFKNLNLESSHLFFGGVSRECFREMCLYGREVLHFEGHNLFDDYIVVTELSYFANNLYLLKPPLLIAFYLQIIFVFVIVLTEEFENKSVQK